ncbi:MAG: hypothetical protein C3F18_06630 [Nitrosomonadales bacterium]|nr:MAG: hypothetical protein C3F18_06630 [Nitrosomonadales bacterium]
MTLSNPKPGLTGPVSWLDARGTLFAALTFAAAVGLLYGRAITGWWHLDEPLILKQAILHSPPEYFFIPRVWRELYAVSFTPWLTLSFDFDYTLFGLRPAAFYAHQLISVWAAVTAFYVLLTAWVSRAFAWMGGWLLMVSAPLALASQSLPIRHYLTGMAFASLAMYLWIRAVREHRRGCAWAGALLFFLAALCKEIYLPLPFMVLLLQEKSWQQRLRTTWPMLLMLALYASWRLWMLGGLGGYGFSAFMLEKAPLLMAGAVLLMPLSFFLKLFGLGYASIAWISVSLVSMLGLFRAQPRRAIVTALAFLVLTAIPLIPLLSFLSPYADAESHRLLFMPAALLAGAVSVGLSRWSRENPRHVALSVAIMSFLGLGLFMHGHSLINSWQMPEAARQEGHFLLSKPGETAALSVYQPNQQYFYEGLAWLRPRFWEGNIPPTVFGGYFELDPLSDASLAGRRVYALDPGCNCFHDVTLQALAKRKSLLGRLQERPLHVEVEWEEGRSRWSLGPYTSGTYFFLAGEHPGWYSTRNNAPAVRGGWALRIAGYVRVGYESPEGWVTLSPEFYLDLDREERFHWDYPVVKRPAVKEPHL